MCSGLPLVEGEYSLETIIDEAGEGQDSHVTAMLPGGGFVVLDTEVTEELEVEGAARDLIRAVQQARREAGLDVELVKVDLGTHTLVADGSDFSRINPKGYVPVLELDNGTRLSEGPARQGGRGSGTQAKGAARERGIRHGSSPDRSPASSFRGFAQRRARNP